MGSLPFSEEKEPRVYSREGERKGEEGGRDGEKEEGRKGEKQGKREGRRRRKGRRERRRWKRGRKRGKKEEGKEGGEKEERRLFWGRKISDNRALSLLTQISLLELARTFTATSRFPSESEYSRFLL